MRRLILSVLLSVSFAAAANAEERIIDYASDISVNKDSSIDVTEHIKVQSEGAQIRHGIYRDFPTRYKDKNGRIKRAEFNVTAIKRDGQAEEYSIKNISGGERIYLGKKDYLLPPNIYSYDISYHTSGWLGFFDSYDELYWNVTGNGWSFPIEKATATLHLPQGASISQLAAYTGAEGAKGSDFTNTTDVDGNIVFTTTRTLQPHEGMTIAVGWPKGFVTKTNTSEPSFLHDNRGIAIALGLFLATAFYCYSVCNAVGRDPVKGTIIPLFSPPDNLSPAECAFVYDMKSNTNKNFAAAIVNMAVKGYLKIKDESFNKYTLTKLSNDNVLLSEEEKVIADKLFRKGDQILIGKVDVMEVQLAARDMDSSLASGWKNQNFSNNLSFKYFLITISLSLLALVGIYLQFSDSGGIAGLKINGQDSTVGAAFLFVCFWSIPAIGTVSALLYFLKKASSGQGGAIIGLLFSLVFALAFFGAELFQLYKIGQSTGMLTPIIILSIFVLNVFVPSLLKAPTVEGRVLMDKIEGFKMYLDVAEENRLNTMNPPKVTPEIFEKFLPYAMALNLQQEWGDKFANEVSRSTADTYTPLWYNGNSFSNSNFNNFSDSFSSGLSNSISSPSSSGSDGGGSSGGGGGGGGGGGW